MADSNGAPVRVLIVDDVAAVRQDLRTALTLAGTIEIAGEAANGLEAARLAECLAPAVVVLDLAMPVMDGYEAASLIKTRSPATRIIALTVHAYASARQKAFEHGIDEFVVKGAPLEALIQAISRWQVRTPSQ